MRQYKKRRRGKLKEEKDKGKQIPLNKYN